MESARSQLPRRPYATNSARKLGAGLTVMIREQQPRETQFRETIVHKNVGDSESGKLRS